MNIPSGGKKTPKEKLGSITIFSHMQGKNNMLKSKAVAYFFKAQRSITQRQVVPAVDQ